MRAPWTVRFVVAAMAAVACGGGGGATDDAATTTGATTAAAATTVAVATSALGDILVDGDGMVLYVFTPDDAGESTCTDGCAENWPPLAGPAGAGDGVDAALLSSVTRADGIEQVTYGGWPLYHFAGDDAPGDTNGQGVNDVWYVVDPSGAAVEAAPGGEAEAESEDEPGGY